MRAKGEVTFAVNEKRHAGTLSNLQVDKWPPGRNDGSVALAGLCRRFVLRLTRTKRFLFCCWTLGKSSSRVEGRWVPSDETFSRPGTLARFWKLNISIFYLCYFPEIKTTAFALMHPTFQLQCGVKCKCCFVVLFFFLFGCGSKIQHKCRFLLGKSIF